MLNKKLSIIIVNYKSAAFLKKCVDSIYKKINPAISFEVIIVNNDSEEKLENILEKKEEIKIINNYKNLGFGAGNNIGAKASQGEMLFFLNPDTEIISLDLEEIFRLFDESDEIGIIGSQLCSREGKIEKWSAGYEINIPDLARNNLGFSRNNKFWQKEKIFETEWVSAAALFIKKEFFEKVGGFDEIFFMYFEDMDLCKRARSTGKKILYYQESKIMHTGGESYQKKKLQKKDYYESQEYYFKKHRNFFEWLAVKMLRKLFY
jgi:GT2 family glycosyltransferase